MEEQLKEIFTSYYFWLAVEAIVLVVLVIFTRKFAGLKKARAAEISARQERSRYSQLDDQITNKK